MRAEPPALAWLLVSLAVASWGGWALAYWNGARGVSLRPAEPAAPSLTAASGPPAALLIGYEEAVKRPLFFEERRPRTFFLPGKEAKAEATAAFDYELTSVMITPELEMAILQPKGGGEPVRVKQGESVPAAMGWKLAGLQPRRAIFEGPHGRRDLELRVFAGTPVPGPGPGAAAPAAPATPAQSVAVPPPQNNASAGTAASGTTMTEEAIRKRIEERRAQMRRAADSRKARR